MMKNSRLRTLTATGIIAAFLCVIAPIAIPIGEVPLSLATLVILVSAAILGPWRSAFAVIVYLILGSMGLLVFSGFSGGVGILLGPTGGFLIGYIALAVISGLGRGKVIPMIAGTLVLYVIGMVWYMIFADVPLWSAVTVCVLPCIPVDVVKIAVAKLAGQRIRK